MIVSLIILAAIVGVGAILYVHHRITYGSKPEEEEPVPVAQEECCGMHIACEKDSLLASVSDKAEYYDDEELDAYKGRTADSYAEDEIEEFRDVLLTLLPDDIAGWGRSLQLRGIAMPEPVKEELLLIVREQREARSKNH